MRYMIQAADKAGKKSIMHDPYSFPQLLTDYDLHLLNEGTHWRCYEKLGFRATGEYWVAKVARTPQDA